MLCTSHVAVITYMFKSVSRHWRYSPVTPVLHLLQRPHGVQKVQIAEVRALQLPAAVYAALSY